MGASMAGRVKKSTSHVCEEYIDSECTLHAHEGHVQANHNAYNWLHVKNWLIQTRHNEYDMIHVYNSFKNIL